MTSLFSRCVLWLLPVALPLLAETGAPTSPNATIDPTPVSAFGFVGIGLTEEEPLRVLSEYVDANLRLTTRSYGLRPAQSSPLRQIAAELATQRPADQAFMIALIQGAPTNQPHGFIDPTGRVAVVQMDPMRSPDPKVQQFRLEKQAMRAACFLLGLSTCPNPRCCLYPYKGFTELDAIGRNTCPPCMFQAERRARELGVTAKPRLEVEEIRKRVEAARKKKQEGAPPGAPLSPPLSPPVPATPP